MLHMTMLLRHGKKNMELDKIYRFTTQYLECDQFEEEDIVYGVADDDLTTYEILTILDNVIPKLTVTQYNQFISHCLSKDRPASLLKLFNWFDEWINDLPPTNNDLCIEQFIKNIEKMFNDRIAAESKSEQKRYILQGNNYFKRIKELLSSYYKWKYMGRHFGGDQRPDHNYTVEIPVVQYYQALQFGWLVADRVNKLESSGRKSINFFTVAYSILKEADMEDIATVIKLIGKREDYDNFVTEFLIKTAVMTSGTFHLLLDNTRPCLDTDPTIDNLYKSYVGWLAEPSDYSRELVQQILAELQNKDN